jgi:hypothetical protein
MKEVAGKFYKCLGELQACFDAVLPINPFEADDEPDPAPERMTATEAVMMDDYKRHREIYKKFIKDPAPPLKARVAKALGYKVIRRQNGEWSMPRSSMEQEYIEYVPPHDEDVALAQKAFWEYLLKVGTNDFCISRQHIRIQDIVVAYDGLYPEAEDYCEAIVKHSEGING